MGFIQELKSCEDIHECSDFNLSLPVLTTLDPEQIRMLNEIAQIAPPLTKIKIKDFRYLSDILKIFKSHKELKGVFIITCDDVSSLNELPTLNELRISIIHKDCTPFPLYNDFLAETPTLVNLSSLFIELSGTKNLKELQFDISNLSELKSFELKLFCQDTENLGSSNRIWLQELFREIGKLGKGKVRKVFIIIQSLLL